MSAETIRAAAVARGLSAAPTVAVEGDGPGFYAAVCDECTGADLGTQPCGETRYYKRDAKADAAAHREAHAAWHRGERMRAWPA